jgi:hypothetical protein
LILVRVICLSTHKLWARQGFYLFLYQVWSSFCRMP